MSLDEDAFKNEMQLQKERARAAREVDTYMGADETVYNRLDTAMVTEFTGYDAKPVTDARSSPL